MKKNATSETVLTFVVLGVVGYFLFNRQEFLYAALGLGAMGLLSKKFSQLLHDSWTYVSGKIGGVMSTLLLSLIFYIILSPVAFLFRFFNKETPFHFSKDEKSTFVERDYPFSAKDLKNPW